VTETLISDAIEQIYLNQVSASLTLYFQFICLMLILHCFHWVGKPQYWLGFWTRIPSGIWSRLCGWGGGSIGPPTFFLSRADRNVTTWVAPRSVQEAQLKTRLCVHLDVETRRNCVVVCEYAWLP